MRKGHNVFLFLTYINSSYGAPRPVANPIPDPLTPSVAQGIIAALTLAHIGMIGYAVHDETSYASFEFVGKSGTDVDISNMIRALAKSGRFNLCNFLMSNKADIPTSVILLSVWALVDT